jgi:cytochrome b561
MTNDNYDTLAKSLHWLMALMIIALWCVGLVLEDLPKGDFKGQMFAVHKGIGVIVLVLTVVRLAWRATHPAPALPNSMGDTEQLAAKAGHLALYGLMILIPVAGILMSQAGGRPVVVAGLTVPTLVGKDEGLHEVFEEAHAILAWILALVLAGHVGAALRHHFMLKDNVLRRMLPGRV